MDNEKQIDIKEKLDMLDSLPGKAFNKEVAWEQLHHRLQDKPRRKIILWYWAAAVLLPLVILTVWISSNKKAIVLAKKTTQQNQEAGNPVIPITKKQKDLTVVLPIASIKKNRPIKKNRVNLYVDQTKKKQLEISDKIIAGTSTANEPPTLVETKPVPHIDVNAASIVSTAAVALRKLRVVYINELETDPAANPDQLASSSNHDQNNFKRRFRNNHSSVNTSATDRQEYTSVIKIPLTN